MKKVSRFFLTFMLAIFCCVDAKAMENSKVEIKPPTISNFRRSLSEWPKVHPFSSQKEMDYYKNSTWFPELTLEQNQKKLVKNFVEKCCDFSFKIQPMGLKGIDVGYLNSGEYLIFTNASTNIESNKDNADMLIYNDRYKNKGGLLARCTTSSFMEYCPVDSGEKYKDKFIECFFKLAEDSVGCKLLRIALTKHVVNNFQKTAFIPAVTYKGDKQSSITCSSGCYICSQLAESENVSAIKYLEQNPRYRFIIFSPAFFSETIPIGVIKYDNGNVFLDIIEFFRESALFHEIIHSLHTNVDDKLLKSINIKRRSNSKKFRYTLKSGGDPVFFRCSRINVSLFHNDEEYSTMYGLTSKGLDLLNESSYLAHRYGFIRASHGDFNPSKKEYMSFFQNFFANYGDRDLFEYYLSQNSPITYPKFGVGQYKCADLDSKTGEKLNSARN